MPHKIFILATLKLVDCSDRMLSVNFKLKRTAAASRGFLATARLSCFSSNCDLSTCIATICAFVMKKDFQSTCSSSVVTVARPAACFSLKITDRHRINVAIHLVSVVNSVLRCSAVDTEDSRRTTMTDVGTGVCTSRPVTYDRTHPANGRLDHQVPVAKALPVPS